MDRARPLLVHRTAAVLAWAALAGFIIYGSIGRPTGDGRGVEGLPGISVPDIAQNVLLYIPFGVFGAWTLRRNSSTGLALWSRVTVIAVGFSSTVELLQLLSASRIASPLDVLANVVGASAGAVAAEPIERMLVAAAERVRPTGLLTAPARYALLAVLAAIVVAAWYPFDVTLDVSTLSHRTRPVRLDPWLRTSTAALWEQGVRFFVLAAVLTVCLPRLGRGAAPVAAVAAVAAAIVIDLGQLAMGAYPVGVAVLLSQAAGAGAGAGAATAVALVRRTWYAAA
jgi:VanZ family protein